MIVTTPLLLPGKRSLFRSGCGISHNDARSKSPVGPGVSPPVTQPKCTRFSNTIDSAHVPFAPGPASPKQSGFSDDESSSSTGPRAAPAPGGLVTPNTRSHGFTDWMTKLSYSTVNSYAPSPSCTPDACSTTRSAPSPGPAQGPCSQIQRLALGPAPVFLALPSGCFSTRGPSGVGVLVLVGVGVSVAVGVGVGVFVGASTRVIVAPKHDPATVTTGLQLWTSENVSSATAPFSSARGTGPPVAPGGMS